MSLELFLGSMGSGKTTKLLQTLTLQKKRGKSVLLVSYEKDIRFDSILNTHDSEYKTSIDHMRQRKLFNYLNYYMYDVIGIDEAHFFPDLLIFSKEMIKLKKQLYISGLDRDSYGEPFGQLILTIPLADEYTQLRTLCSYCDKKASFTLRLNKENKETIFISGFNDYVPVCRYHYKMYNTESKEKLINNIINLPSKHEDQGNQGIDHQV